MKRRKDIFNAFFKAQDRFQLAAPSGFEPDVIHDYIHWGMVLSSSYEHEAEDENLLLCELFCAKCISTFSKRFKTQLALVHFAESALIRFTRPYSASNVTTISLNMAT